MVYLDIYIYGIFFLSCTIFRQVSFSALGDSRTPLLFLAVSSVSNIFLDILFVTSFQMGVAGVAWATFIAQGGSGVLSFVVLLRRLQTISTEGKVKWFSPAFMAGYAGVCPGNFAAKLCFCRQSFTQRLINSYGPGVIAGYSSAIKLNNFASLSLVAFCGRVRDLCRTEYWCAPV